jgi:tetratricopeptide (TPR) repeat protein
MSARRTRAPRLIATTAIAGLLSIVTAAAPGPGTDDAVIERWTRAVVAHTPGRVDEPLSIAAALTYDDRQRLDDALDPFFDAMIRGRIDTSSAIDARAAQLGADAARSPGANAFLERAAVLHADTVIFAARLPSPPADPRDVGGDALVSSTDGEYEGTLRPSWHEKFARDLLDRITPRPSTDPFVGRWYHAMIAYLFSGTRYGEASPLLRRAAEILPDDARILFDRACLSETLGAPHIQAVLNDPRVQNTDAALNFRPGRAPTPRGATRVVAVGERQANSEAESLFRRALDADGSLVEARMRLGRLLLLRGRDAEAATMLAQAVTAARDPAVAYLSHLLAARADERLDELDEAAAHADAALALFPGAQSALIAKSHIALQRADAAGALDPIILLARRDSRVPPRDPWSEYYLGAGRDSTLLLSDLWASIGR